ncbi:HDOD domain-containing protein [Alkalimarinus alittae]|uniref:HDOD domain-containing protein n=1 Tax=Alkalimarinus alittae TaxID=2961619 RepID=A0ABY6N4P4_9ALTE|nr:HDOD domain-containing protein [Alkalimarinus alittae]UZE96984.1 HDOD domain-containing protein [Alkalimarinus alittae]
MNKSDTFSGAKEWSEFLSVQVLPIGPIVGKQILQTLSTHELPYKKLAELANNDPVFCYHIISKANQNKEEKAPYSKNLEHAISMIGTEQLKQITLSLPTQGPKPSNTQQLYYARAINASLLASYLAYHFSTIKQPSQAKDSYWGALLCGVPMWYLWEFASTKMKQVRKAMHVDFKPSKEAEIDIFGCTLPAIAEALVEHLNLPPLTKACYMAENQLTPKQWIKVSQHVDQNGRPRKVDDKDIKLITSHPSFSITLANLLAYYASQDWYSKSTLRVQKAIAVYLGVSLHQVVSLTHQCAIDMSREHPMPGIMLPAAKLLLPPREKQKKQRPSPQQNTPPHTDTPISVAPIPEAHLTVDNTAPAPINPVEPTIQTKSESSHVAKQAPKKQPRIKSEKELMQEGMMEDSQIEQAPRGDKAVFNEFTNIMLKNPDNFVDLHELMNAATQCLSYGLGLEKAIVALISTNETRLKAYYSVGTRDYPELSSYQESLTKPSLFSRLIEKPSSVWVKPDSSKSIWAMIPPEFKVASGAREFFLMSIFINKKPVAIFYADSGHEKRLLTDEDYKQFKYMCGAATHCLQYLAEKRTKKT